jgi:hypothetical protein
MNNRQKSNKHLPHYRFCHQSNSIFVFLKKECHLSTTKQFLFIKPTSSSLLLLSLEQLCAVEAREALQDVIAHVDAATSEQIAVIAKTYVRIGYYILSLTIVDLDSFCCALLSGFAAVFTQNICAIKYQMEEWSAKQMFNLFYSNYFFSCFSFMKVSASFIVGFSLQFFPPITYLKELSFLHTSSFIIILFSSS